MIDSGGNKMNIHTDPWGRGSLPIGPCKPDSRIMQLVLSFEGGTPGYTLWRDYQVCRNPGGSHWILWESIEDEDSTSMRCVTYEPVACALTTIDNVVEVSKMLLRELWTEHAKIYDRPNCMDYFTADGLLSKYEIEEILKAVWPQLQLDGLCG
jgi:hypothetical protein